VLNNGFGDLFQRRTGGYQVMGFYRHVADREDAHQLLVAVQDRHAADLRIAYLVEHIFDGLVLVAPRKPVLITLRSVVPSAEQPCVSTPLPALSRRQH
jgi:hypothetical protein